MYLQRNKLKTCYDAPKFVIHSSCTKVECVAHRCSGYQLPSSCWLHPHVIAEGVVSRLLYLLLVAVDPDPFSLPSADYRLKCEGDSPHPSHGDCEHAWEYSLQVVMRRFTNINQTWLNIESYSCIDHICWRMKDFTIRNCCMICRPRESVSAPDTFLHLHLKLPFFNLLLL